MFCHVTGFSLPPCEVDADVGRLIAADLSEGERGDIAPDPQRFLEDASHRLLVHLRGKADEPAGVRQYTQDVKQQRGTL